MVRFRKRKNTAVVGDAFAVPLEGGLFTVCRVLAVDVKAGTMLVANADWIGRQIPDVNDPALRPIMQLTHHNWSGKLCATWVTEALPKDYVPIGSISFDSSEQEIVEAGSGIGSWAFFKVQALAQWQWNHPADVPRPPPRPQGKFILHRFNGDEVFRFKNAVIFAYFNEPHITLWFEVSADSNALQRCEDTVQSGTSPNAEVGIDLSELDADQLVGRSFVIPGTKSDDEDSCMSLLYYFEHEPLRENRITIVSRSEDRFWLRWTGITPDINHYDGSKPFTHVEIEGEFLFKEISNWVGD